MKRCLSLIMIAMLTLNFVGCSSVTGSQLFEKVYLSWVNMDRSLLFEDAVNLLDKSTNVDYYTYGNCSYAYINERTQSITFYTNKEKSGDYVMVIFIKTDEDEKYSITHLIAYDKLNVNTGNFERASFSSDVKVRRF